MAKSKTFRVVTRGEHGELRIKDYDSPESILSLHSQIGVDDCSTDLSLRGLPVFRGLIGPMGDEGGVVRYESPDVFEALTKEWIADGPHKKKRRRRSKAKAATAAPAMAPVATSVIETPAASPIG